VDEAASGRAPGGMALRDRQTGRQGSLGWKAAFLAGSSRPIRPVSSSIPIVRATLRKRLQTKAFSVEKRGFVTVRGTMHESIILRSATSHVFLLYRRQNYGRADPTLVVERVGHTRD